MPAPTWLWSHAAELIAGAGPRPPIMGSAGRGGAAPYRAGAGDWQPGEGCGGALRANGWEALEDTGWEFLVEHAVGNDGNHRPA